MIKAIIFDMVGVLLMEKGDICEIASNTIGVDSEELREMFVKNIDKLFRKEMTSEQFFDLVKKRFKLSEDIGAVWEKAHVNYREVNEDLMEAIAKMKKNYKVGIISNTHSLVTRIRKNTFARYFDFTVFSSDVGFAKPDKEIFKIALEKALAKPEECVFVDDQEENLEAAKELGFNTILFKNNEQLLKELKDLGVKF